jgi:hypothetical protein
VCSRTHDADLLKQFFNLHGETVRDSTVTQTDIDDVSLVSSSVLGSELMAKGSIKRSVLSNVRAKYIEADGAILINVTAEKIIAKPGSIVYNIVDSSVGGAGIVVEEGQVLAGVFYNDGTQHVVKSVNTIDGGKAWETKVEGNPLSFEEVYNSNFNADPSHLERVAVETHGNAWKDIHESESAKLTK